jgi:pimeloyl-ACP methyl ester carboxylesterase
MTELDRDTGGGAGGAGGIGGPGGAVPGTSPQVMTVPAADGARLAVRVDGDPEAPVTVLLSHGWTLTAAGWGPHIAALAAREGPPLRIVSFDQRGHGFSDRGTAPIDLPVFGADLAAVLQACCRPGGSTVVVGHSLGAMALLACAAERPELFGGPDGLVSGAVLVSASAGGPLPEPSAGAAESGRRAALRERVGRLETALVEAVLNREWAARAAHRLLTGPAAHPRTLPLWRLAFGDGPDAELARRSAEDFRETPVSDIADYWHAFARHDCTGRIGALGRVPVRILVGAEDRFATPAESAAIAAELPSAELNMVPGYGHDLPYDRPDLGVRAVDGVVGELMSGDRLGGIRPGPEG